MHRLDAQLGLSFGNLIPTALFEKVRLVVPSRHRMEAKRQSDGIRRQGMRALRNVTRVISKSAYMGLPRARRVWLIRYICGLQVFVEGVKTCVQGYYPCIG